MTYCLLKRKLITKSVFKHCFNESLLVVTPTVAVTSFNTNVYILSLTYYKLTSIMDGALCLIILYAVIKVSGQPANCPPFPNVDHATAKWDKTEQTMQVRCSPGYRNYGYRSLFKCLKGVWNPHIEIVCEQISCRDPGKEENSIRVVGGFLFGEEIKYSCNIGYEPKGEYTLLCQADGLWTGSPRPCTIVSCPSLGDIAQASRIRYSNGLMFQSMVTITCKTCRTLTGSRERVCQADKTWSGNTVTCSLTDCGKPRVPFYGKLSKLGTTCATTVEFLCKKDGILDKTKDSHIICNELGKWVPALVGSVTHYPDCYAPCTVSAVQNGSVSSHVIGSTMRHDTTIDITRFSCDARLKLSTKTSPRCRNQTWTIWPQCLEGPCDVPVLENGSVLGYNIGDVVPKGTTISFQCDKRYTLSHKAELLCKQNSFILSDLPSCVPNPCVQFDQSHTIQALKYSCTNSNNTVPHGCTATYVCASQTLVSRCDSGVWEPLPSDCVTHPASWTTPLSPTSPATSSASRPTPLLNQTTEIIAGVFGTIAAICLLAVIGWLIHWKFYRAPSAPATDLATSEMLEKKAPS